MGLPQTHGTSRSAGRKLWQATHSVPVVRYFLTMNGSGIYLHANKAAGTPQCAARATYDVADRNKARMLCGSTDGDFCNARGAASGSIAYENKA